MLSFPRRRRRSGYWQSNNSFVVRPTCQSHPPYSPSFGNPPPTSILPIHLLHCWFLSCFTSLQLALPQLLFYKWRDVQFLSLIRSFWHSGFDQINIFLCFGHTNFFFFFFFFFFFERVLMGYSKWRGIFFKVFLWWSNCIQFFTFIVFNFNNHLFNENLLPQNSICHLKKSWSNLLKATIYCKNIYIYIYI